MEPLKFAVQILDREQIGVTWNSLLTRDAREALHEHLYDIDGVESALLLKYSAVLRVARHVVPVESVLDDVAAALLTDPDLHAAFRCEPVLYYGDRRFYAVDP